MKASSEQKTFVIAKHLVEVSKIFANLASFFFEKAQMKSSFVSIWLNQTDETSKLCLETAFEAFEAKILLKNFGKRLKI